mgnify:CR=1 FL=1
MKQFAILGYPLGHSLSPQLHKMLAEELGEELSYHVFEISPEEFDQKKAELFSLDGFNITIPYKVRIMDSLDELDQSAKNHGAVNTVSIKNGCLAKPKRALTPTVWDLSRPWSKTEFLCQAGSACWVPAALAECLQPSVRCAAVRL